MRTLATRLERACEANQMNTRHLLHGALLTFLALGAGRVWAQHEGAVPPCAAHGASTSLSTRPDTAWMNGFLRILEALPKKQYTCRDAPLHGHDDGIWMDPRMEARLRSPFGTPAGRTAAPGTVTYGIRAEDAGRPCRPHASADGLVELLEEALRMARALAREEDPGSPMPHRP